MNAIRKSLLLAALLLPLSASAQFSIKVDKPIKKLQIAEMAIEELYVDTVNEQRLVEDAIRGMLRELDPHSSYSTAKETRAMNEPLQGSFEGIGVQFNMVEDTLLVIQTVHGGPSEKAGLLAGDRIVSVGDSVIAGVKMSKEEIMRRLRGPKGSRAELGIVRRGVSEVLHFTVKRDKIPVHTIDASYMLRPGVGYVRIGSFGATTYHEFMACVDSLSRHGMHDLVLDLQDNGGGYLQAAVNIAEQFLDKGDLVVFTQGRRVPRHNYTANGRGKLRSGRVVVLVNEYTASAAEIVTGALQDQDRAQVVGRRTYGKGLVQRPIEFSDGSMIRLTVAHYYTPTGRCIQKPYVKGGAKDYAADLLKRFKHGEFFTADSIHLADSLRYLTLRRHRAVYGGGGIMPDYFVPLDTAQLTPYHRRIASRNYIVNATLKYVDRQRKQLLSEYPTFADFNARFQVPKAMTDSLIAQARCDKIEPKDAAELKATLPMLRLQLKALVARDLWEQDQYFQIINETSSAVQKALELLGRKK
jgi:carboxyl-terminal processing protease